ncbi:hypothetical protein BDK51DRAFT_42015 [Blyttiomyces helicus]|uniref:Uncharacterized protein n=1 Tax=Blyttiomyces helicus TaxID=388810 RepID=A0A4P9WBM8_9FUNG|nr:hypothetical protein BDK51DRAFT_42015 [Blyttiomyces helicus]|eukprot:RKO90029.1 hypothetical protein BDK51DRAFT_42015 [Blyttiomyces helicus]
MSYRSGGLMKSADWVSMERQDLVKAIGSCLRLAWRTGFGDAAQHGGGGVRASVQGRSALGLHSRRYQAVILTSFLIRSPHLRSHKCSLATLLIVLPPAPPSPTPQTAYAEPTLTAAEPSFHPVANHPPCRPPRPAAIAGRSPARHLAQILRPLPQLSILLPGLPARPLAPTQILMRRVRGKNRIDNCESDGIRAILFDHVFGGVLSLLKKDGIREHGPGMVLRELSCASEEFCSPKDAGRAVHRSIRSTYVPESGMAALDERWAPFETMFDLYLMNNWLSIDRVPRGAINTGIFKDWDLEMTPPSIIPSDFYRDMMATNDVRHKKQSALPPDDDGMLPPPLGLTFRLLEKRRGAS